MPSPPGRRLEGFAPWSQFAAQRAEQEAALEPATARVRAPRHIGPSIPAQLDAVPYVELHAHSNYSLLEGASHLDELMEKATEQGHAALALTDHDGMFGAMEFARMAVAAGVRPITGLELTSSRRTAAAPI